MKRTSLIANGLVLVGMFYQQGIAQPTVRKKQTIEIDATIVAYDGWANASNMTFAPSRQEFVVRIEKKLVGKEKSRYLKVIYEYFSSDGKNITDLLSENKFKWNFRLLRDSDCDSSLKDLKYGNIKSVTDGRDLGKALKLKDLDGLDDISEDTKMPCYILSSDGIKKIKSK